MASKVMRSMVARTFGPAKFGLALGAVATLQQITQVVSPTTFPLVWKATAGINGTVSLGVAIRFLS